MDDATPTTDAAPDTAGLREAWRADHEVMLRHTAELALDFRRSLGGRLQRPQKSFSDMCRAFAAPLPERGCEGMAAITELATLAEPGLAATAGARSFGWVIGGSHPIGVAADWLTSAWGQNGAAHAMSPAGAASEAVAAAWLLELLDLPRGSSVGFGTGTTMANLTCLAAARGEVLRRAHWNVETNGLFGAPPIRVIVGDEAHASVFFALQVLGFGRARIFRVATDQMGRMKTDELEAMIGSGGSAIVIAQAGHVNTGAFDPIPRIVEIARRANAWVHVDGAFGLWARTCPETAPLAAELDKADSWATDGHKWLQLPHDTGFAIVRDPEAHRRAMTITASYLPDASEGERNPSDYVPELSRRTRGFATWAMMRALGRDGIAHMVAEHCRLARHMAQALSKEAGIRILNDVVLNQIVVRFGDSDLLTGKVIEHIQTEGICFVAGAQWKGLRIMRVSVISWATTRRDADRAVAAIVGAWRSVREDLAR